MRRCCRWQLLLKELRAVRVATNVSHRGQGMGESIR
jgi:hypothetical protein